MSKRGAVYILALHEQGTSASSKRIITSAARDYAKWYHVPRTHHFSTRVADHDHASALSATSFSKMTLRDKLIVVGHGTTTSVGEFASASTLADALAAQWGLTQAGVITFKACHIGADGFLDLFNMACIRNGITVGWLKGYTGSAATSPRGGWLVTVFGGLLWANGVDVAVDNFKPVERITDRKGQYASHRVLLIRGAAGDRVPRPATRDALELPG